MSSITERREIILKRKGTPTFLAKGDDCKGHGQLGRDGERESRVSTRTQRGATGAMRPFGASVHAPGRRRGAGRPVSQGMLPGGGDAAPEMVEREGSGNGSAGR